MTINTTVTKRDPYGYYQVGSQKFSNKLDAAYSATAQRLPLTWDFHDDVFSKIDWTIRPAGTLKDLYRERAQQIRDNYDYVIVYFSGGSDSWTVLHSFLSNNIHVDEIRTNWASAARKYYDPDPTNFHEINIMSEFEFSIVPVLDHVKKHYPKTRIVYNDYSGDFQGTDFKEEFIARSNHWQNMSSPFRPQGSSDESATLINKDRRVAAVYGFEKIKLRCINKKLYMYFNDTAGGAEMPDGKNIEFFFTTPDFPLISVLQAHCCRDEVLLQKKPTVENLAIRGAAAVSVNQRGDWHWIHLNACYPDYNPNTFQTGKQLGSLVRASDAWILRYNPTFFKSWRWAYTQYFKNIDEKYITKTLGNLITGLKYVASPSYLIDNNFNFPDFDASGSLHPPLIEGNIDLNDIIYKNKDFTAQYLMNL